MNYYVLSQELINDPLARGYSGMTDSEAADDLNIVNRQRNLSSMTGDDIFQATDSDEFIALSSDNRLLWMSLCARQIIDPFGLANVETVVTIFGVGSDTVSNLSTIRVENVSRAVELGLAGEVIQSDVTKARAL